MIDSDDGWSSDEFDDIPEQDSANNSNQSYDVSRIKWGLEWLSLFNTIKSVSPWLKAFGPEDGTESMSPHVLAKILFLSLAM